MKLYIKLYLLGLIMFSASVGYIYDSTSAFFICLGPGLMLAGIMWGKR